MKLCLQLCCASHSSRLTVDWRLEWSNVKASNCAALHTVPDWQSIAAWSGQMSKPGLTDWAACCGPHSLEVLRSTVLIKKMNGFMFVKNTLLLSVGPTITWFPLFSLISSGFLLVRSSNGSFYVIFTLRRWVSKKIDHKPENCFCTLTTRRPQEAHTTQTEAVRSLAGRPHQVSFHGLGLGPKSHTFTYWMGKIMLGNESLICFQPRKIAKTWEERCKNLVRTIFRTLQESCRNLVRTL